MPGPATPRTFSTWSPDGLNRPYQVWRHGLGAPASADELVYKEADPRFELTLAASRSGELIIITAASRDTTEVRIIPAGLPLGAPVLVEPRRRGGRVPGRSRGRSGRWRGDLLIVTDDGAPEFTLMRAPVAAPGRAHWTPVDCPAIAPARADTRLIECDVLAGHLRADAAPRRRAAAGDRRSRRRRRSARSARLCRRAPSRCSMPTTTARARWSSPRSR